VQPSKAHHVPSPTAHARTSCSLAGSQADYQVCAFPAVAQADQDLKLAYQRAQSAGVPADSLKVDQAQWQSDREMAAHRSAAQLTLAYRDHIARVDALAVEAPH
jgi:uncharacterized protein